MLTVALTGGIGCGKSTVCQLFSKHGAPVIDTDILSRELVEPGTPALSEIISHFGQELLQKDGSLNRKALSNIVFKNSEQRKILESILHPKIRAEIERQLQNIKSDYTIIAIPLLIETNQQSTYDRVLVIDCSEHLQFERTISRDGRSPEEVEGIIKTQASREARLKLADDVITNDSSLSSLEQQVQKLHSQYLSLAR